MWFDLLKWLVKAMKKMLIIICLVCCSCCSQYEQAKAEKRAEIRRETAKREEINNKAVNTAIVKYLLDPSWSFKEVEKEIRYQQYIQGQKAGSRVTRKRAD